MMKLRTRLPTKKQKKHCKLCNKSYKHPVYLLMHYKTCHPSSPELLEYRSEFKRLLSCPICDRKFEKVYLKNKHLSQAHLSKSKSSSWTFKAFIKITFQGTNATFARKFSTNNETWKSIWQWRIKFHPNVASSDRWASNLFLKRKLEVFSSISRWIIFQSMANVQSKLLNLSWIMSIELKSSKFEIN